MRAWLWLVLISLIVSAGAGCGEDQRLWQPLRAEAMLVAARARFKLLDQNLSRGLSLEQAGDRFRPLYAPPRPRSAAPPGAPSGAWRRPGAHRIEATLPAQGDGVLRLSSGPVTLEVRPLGARRVPGAVADRALVYAGAYPGADSIHVAERGRVEEFILLRDARAPDTFDYQLKVVRGGGLVRQIAGVVEVLDSVGIAWLRLERPVAVDAAGGDRAVHFALVGQKLTLRLASPARRFPVLLDPGWSATASMSIGRADAAMARLKSGKVLVAGGWPGRGPVQAGAELYDPATGTWTVTGPMATGREDLTLSLLPVTGKVLAVGGRNKGSAHDTAELYDPATGKWSTAGTMSAVREDHSATVLKSGKVLVAGGTDNKSVHASAELYDPATGKWTVTGSMGQVRRFQVATLLPGSGKVLVAGGRAVGFDLLRSADLYDPATGKWTATGDMSVPREHHTADLLATGQVLVYGGNDKTKAHGTAERYDPKTGKWSATGGLSGGRKFHASVQLKSGKVLAVGGQDTDADELTIAELYDPAKGSWSVPGNLIHGRAYHVATLLNSGQVLTTGGWDLSSVVLASAELYDATTGQACTSGATCHSGFCADGICCESACDEPCKRCQVDYSNQGVLGKCVYVAQGKPDPKAAAPCGGSRVCDGGGNCREPPGGKCAVTADCPGPASREVFPLNSVWKYHDQGTDLGSAWLALGYNDSAWSSGKGQLGYGDNDENTVLFKPSARYPSVYFRKKITLDAAPNSAALKLIYDDGAVVWINGTQVYSINAGYGAAYGAWASAESDENDKESMQILQPAGKGPLKKGDNIIAVMLKQVGPTSSDISFDMALTVWGTAGHCVDGVCCDQACLGGCKGCNAPGHVGTCVLLPLETPDPTSTPPCTGTKACDGKGNCMVARGNSCTLSSKCASGFCQDFSCCEKLCESTCYSCGVAGKLGSCSPVPAGQADLVASSHCSNGFACDGKGNCKKAAVTLCTASSQCASGHCVDGYCCHSACGETCMSCDQKGALGFCAVVSAGSQDKKATSPCVGNKVCDGSGGCLTAAGQACTKGSPCSSGFCADGVCCKKACAEPCYACDLAGSKGSCSPVLSGKPDLSANKPCAGMQSCDGKGTCLAADGQTCGVDKDCSSDQCVDGYCCDTACNKLCQTCKLAGKEGTCSPHPPKSDPEQDCIGKDLKCGGLCDGSGACVFPTAGTLCGAAACMACDGTGRCDEAPLDDTRCGVIDCDKLDTACEDYHDLTDLRCDALGVCKKANDPKGCGKVTALKCADAGVDRGAPDVGVTPDRGVSVDLGAPAQQEQGCSYGVGGGELQLWLGVLLLLVVTRRRRS